MGWGIGKNHRDAIMASCRAMERQRGGRRYLNTHGVVERQLSGTKSTSHIIWPGSGHRAVGDAPALIRSKATGLIIPYAHDAHLMAKVSARPPIGRSAVQVATSVITDMQESKPAEIDIFFDLANVAAYPKQRAAVAVERAARGNASAAKLTTILRQFACVSVAEVLMLDPNHLPLLESRLIDWAAVFNIPAIKPWAWRVFQNALVIAAVRRLTTAAADPTLIVRIWCTDGKTMYTIAKDRVSTETVHLEVDFGEADLRVFYSAAQASIAGAAVVVHSIDTDFLLMAVSAAWFSPLTTVLLRLKHDVYNLRDCTAAAGPDQIDRLNRAYWMMSLGSDYSNTLTNNGYLSKGLCSLITSTTTGPYTRSGLNVQFSMASAKQVLSGIKRCKKKTPPAKELDESLLDMHFCVQYYGFMFDKQLQPPCPPLSKVGETPAPFLIAM